MRHLWIAFFLAGVVHAQNVVPLPAAPTPGQIVASGTVPDEATKASVLAKLREVYGAERVVDQIAIGPVVLPANWAGHVQKLINPNLKLISRGQLKIDGNNVNLRGEVANELQRQQIASDIASSLNPTYTVTNGLRVSASEQNLLDKVLAGRIVEFEIGRANLAATGKTILDEMAIALKQIPGKRFEVIGHTDGQGLRPSNLALSQARSDAVKTYLVEKGINPDLITTSGHGPDRPVASNDSAEGRARNRRIEFRVAQ
jgi:OOP family OmpA-OmpF porin